MYDLKSYSLRNILKYAFMDIYAMYNLSLLCGSKGMVLLFAITAIKGLFRLDASAPI